MIGVSRLLRSALAATSLTGLSVLVVSCVDVLGIEYTDGSSELCELLDACLGDDAPANCSDAVGAKLEGAEPSVRERFLQSFNTMDCLDTCTNARNCLELSPLCEQTGAECSTDAECCGFTTGEGACGVDGACCKPVAIECVDSSECCGDVDCLEVSGLGILTCGGVTCAGIGINCQLGSECCSGSCFGPDGARTCGTCVEEGDPCDFEGQCCQGSCIDNVCSTESCTALGASCTSNEECCDGACNDGICAECLPTGSDCQNGDACCGECIPGQFVCGSLDCLPLGAECGDGQNLSCCGQGETSLCVEPYGNICFQCTPVTDMTCDRTSGDPISEDCILCDGKRAELVCAEDPRCCCAGGGWDAICEAAVAQHCPVMN